MDLLTRMVEHHIWLVGEVRAIAGEGRLDADLGAGDPMRWVAEHG